MLKLQTHSSVQMSEVTAGSVFHHCCDVLVYLFLRFYMRTTRNTKSLFSTFHKNLIRFFWTMIESTLDPGPWCWMKHLSDSCTEITLRMCHFSLKKQFPSYFSFFSTVNMFSIFSSSPCLHHLTCGGAAVTGQITSSWLAQTDVSFFLYWLNKLITLIIWLWLPKTKWGQNESTKTNHEGVRGHRSHMLSGNISVSVWPKPEVH